MKQPETMSSELIKRVEKMIRAKKETKSDFVENFGHINPPMAIRSENNDVIFALDGKVYLRTNGSSYNFANIIHDNALIALGIDFFKQGLTKPFEKLHPIIQWFSSVHSFDDNIIKPIHLGHRDAWYRLAYDLYTIRDNATLKEQLKKRLINPLTFQGARHELRVAAICVAAGFNLDFQDESDGNSTHPEFIAADKFSSNKIAVEAKSRHRNGILGFTEGKIEEHGNSVKAKSLVTKAYKKASEIPYYIFVDVNLPPYKDEQQFKTWIKELEDSMIDLAAAGYTNPCPANAIFFCNDPSHHVTDRALNSDTNALWIKHFIAELPKTPHPSEKVVERIMKAFTQRVRLPEEIDFKF
ncbi:hypothetical protein [Pseudobdellovibrio exovorus]|uniref:Uncharacterized protein n=1 Tax=Pseudobdellovibrio exovorus JSS TaxID=1184267 RepID=M4VBN3_9BACT|nr:hypothetical protein [Pseudobdellovibrio exovorus]AGH96628.1 hypothetical protein A11Q_2412 [Pseudobdellovibrio exovorus JSS]